MAEIRAIAIDLDDTLLRSDISISGYTRDVLQQAMKKGIRIVIATGRMFQAARPWGRAIGLGDVPLICYTGAMAGLCESGRILYHKELSLSLTRKILNTVRGHHWYMHSYIRDTLYVPFRDERTDKYEKDCGVRAHVLGEDFWMPSEGATKLLIYEKGKTMEEVKKVMKEEYGKVTDQVMSKPYFFEINHPGCTKGNALKELCRSWHIPTESLMTFGNSENDISMFTLTPWSFAVANATDEAKKAASRLTGSNDEDGVAHAVEKYVLSR